MRNSSEVFNGQLYVYHNSKLKANSDYQTKLCLQVVTLSEQIIEDCSQFSDVFHVQPLISRFNLSNRSSGQTVLLWILTICGLILTVAFVLILLLVQIRRQKDKSQTYKTSIARPSKSRVNLNVNGVTSTLGLLDYQDVPLLSSHSSRGQLPATPAAIGSQGDNARSAYNKTAQRRMSSLASKNGRSTNAVDVVDASDGVISNEDNGSLPVPLLSIPGYVERLKSNDGFLLLQEFESIDSAIPVSWQSSMQPQNRAKNRYANIVPYDHSRVVLNLPDQIDGYINASYINGYSIERRYIATQGPLPNTFADFWWMVWQEQISIIVMLTKLEERRRLKCDRYWPLLGQSLPYGRVEVAFIEEQTYALYTFRRFRLKLANECGPRTVHHLQFVGWPDFGVPESPIEFLSFIHTVRGPQREAPGHSDPLVVHCSAGVGRTGCFIALDTCCDQIELSGLKPDNISIDIRKCLSKLRSERNYMIQTEEQLAFTYDCLSELARSYQGRLSLYEIAVNRQLREAILQRLSFSPSDGSSGIETEFRRLASSPLTLQRFKAAHLPMNRFKNRLMNIIPFDFNRVTLGPSGENPTEQQLCVSSNGSVISDCVSTSTATSTFANSSNTGQYACVDDYINASFIDGFLSQKEFIATQGPLPHTIDDFWRMIWQKDCGILVMLTNTCEMGKERCAQYWPVNPVNRLQCGDHQVDVLAEYDMTHYILRECRLTSLKNGQCKTIRQFHFSQWPEQGVPLNTNSFLQLLLEVKRTRQQFGLENYPIVVHGSSGAGRTGVFISIFIASESVLVKHTIDIFTIVKLLRAQRPAMVQTEDQYQFCYRVVLDYCETCISWDCDDV